MEKLLSPNWNVLMLIVGIDFQLGDELSDIHLGSGSFSIYFSVHFEVIDGASDWFAVPCEENVLFFHAQKILRNASTELVVCHISFSIHDEKCDALQIYYKKWSTIVVLVKVLEPVLDVASVMLDIWAQALNDLGKNRFRFWGHCRFKLNDYII